MIATERIQELIKIISLPESDYWYDVACVDASELLAAGGEQLINELLLLVKGMTPAQQEHLAYILGDNATTGGLAILEVLKGSEHAEVSYRAQEALNNTPAPK